MATFGPCCILLLWALLAAVSSDTEHAGKCLSDWVFSPSSHTCIKFYYWFSNRKTWENARAACQRDGGDLLAIYNAEMNEFVAAGECPSGWKQCPSSGTCIKVYERMSTWQDARAACKKDNGDLLKIRDQRMNQFAEDIRESNGLNVIWLGLSDRHSEKKFYWLDETIEITYTNWSPSNPRDLSFNGGHCVGMGSNGAGQWTTFDCSDKKPFLCERKPTCRVVDGTCPAGWVKSPTSCIKLYNDERLWQDARTACQQDGGDLVKVQDDCMSKSIEEQIKSRPADDNFWIGLSDQIKEGTWRWLDDDEAVIYKNWAPGQPNNHQVSGHKRGQDCVEIGSHKKAQWNDQDCNVAYKFICEKPAGSTTSK
ncbi:C-type mannose receptor 2 [Plakobranchus ocellatus]|uniref:C-type mannose receptor 2 n=1 Tax=Plakobranchus ocellatus TaxID=259542 RepID=A0AAV3Y8P4_9GAST|nr:C-type mannose receptor 2 [Plakobranchus ocellatus]